MKELKSVQAVIKTITLLEALTHKDEMGVTELAKRVAGNKSTVYRFLNTLKELGYVRQNPQSEQYSLTLKMYITGSVVLDRIGVIKAALPIMEKLARETRETIHLATLDEGRLVYLHKIDSNQSLRVTMMSKVGHTAPFYCTGVGKALLAFQPEEIRKNILAKEKLKQFTPSTITDKTVLEKELENIREKGYSIDNEEHEIGVSCVASPIFDREKKVIASLSISAPHVRMASERIVKLFNLVKEAGGEISTILGYEN